MLVASFGCAGRRGRGELEGGGGGGGRQKAFGNTNAKTGVASLENNFYMPARYRDSYVPHTRK